MEAEFLQGAQERGRAVDKAKDIFAMMAKFAGYGFNRGHAYAYSALAFQLAYFKTHYPDVFFDIMLNYSSSGYITDALQFDFQAAKLSINNIPYHDRFDKRQIYMGLKNIKDFPRDCLLDCGGIRDFSVAKSRLSNECLRSSSSTHRGGSFGGS